MTDATQYRMAYPKFKVFIFGVDVSDDVASINATYHDGKAPNTCQITLLNERDKYMVTTRDMFTFNNLVGKDIQPPWLRGDTTYGATDVSSYRGTAGVDEFISAMIRGDKENVLDPIKERVLEAKKGATTAKVAMSDRVDPFGRQVVDPAYANYFGTDVKRYPLADGAPIFHAMDQVRVFMRDPYDPSRWYHHFAGFVSDMVDTCDENNVKNLTILVEDVTKLFRYSRVFLNPGIVDANIVIQESTDLKIQSFHNKPFSGQSLPEILFTIIFGPDRAGNERFVEEMNSAKAKSNITTRLRGIGHFDFESSGIFTFGPGDAYEKKNVADPVDAAGANKTSSVGNSGKKYINNIFDLKSATHISELKSWETVIDHEVHHSDLYTMLSESLKSVATGSGLVKASGYMKEMAQGGLDGDGLVSIEAIIDRIGSSPEEYPIDGGKLYMLIPLGFGVDNSRLLLNDLISTYPLESEWQSAGELLMSCIEAIQFCMYASPRGDLIVEPPLYDFDPDDFGMKPVESSEFKHLVSSVNSNERAVVQDNGQILTLETAENALPSRKRGPYGPNYIVTKADMYNWESAIIDEKVHTIATCAANIFANWDLGSMSIIGKIAVMKLPELIPLYGARALPVTAPSYIETPEAAHLYASLFLNRQNADAHTLKVSMLPNIAIKINRPIYVEGRNCIATTKQITQSITWGQAGDMSTSIDLYATRTWTGQITADNPPAPVYAPIGGNSSAAVNYAVLFKTKKTPEPTASDSIAEHMTVANSVGLSLPNTPLTKTRK